MSVRWGFLLVLFLSTIGSGVVVAETRIAYSVQCGGDLYSTSMSPSWKSSLPQITRKEGELLLGSAGGGFNMKVIDGVLSGYAAGYVPFQVRANVNLGVGCVPNGSTVVCSLYSHNILTPTATIGGETITDYELQKYHTTTVYLVKENTGKLKVEHELVDHAVGPRFQSNNLDTGMLITAYGCKVTLSRADVG